MDIQRTQIAILRFSAQEKIEDFEERLLYESEFGELFVSEVRSEDTRLILQPFRPNFKISSITLRKDFLFAISS